MEEKIRNNILIAEFMGYKKSLEDKDPEHCRWYYPGGSEEMFYPEEFRYNESWDWLMPVVEKISSLTFHSQGAKWNWTVEITSTYTSFSKVAYGKLLEQIRVDSFSSGYDMKKTTYKAVVEFIEQQGK